MNPVNKIISVITLALTLFGTLLASNTTPTHAQINVFTEGNADVDVAVTTSLNNQVNQATSGDTGWIIDDFHADITVHPDTTVMVTETINVDFNRLQKHGIYRLIPVKYKTRFGNNLNIRFDLHSVTNQHGQSIPVQTSREGDNVKLKIGDATRTVSGSQTYLIRYSVHQVITKPTDQAELYWNVTGNGWPVPITTASATVTALASDSILDAICFTGFAGDTTQSCTLDHNTKSATFKAANLNPHQGLTISTAFDPAAFAFPTSTQQLLWFLADNWLFAVPLVTLTVMYGLYWRRGRDKRYKHMFQETGDVETVPLFEGINPLTVYGPPKDLSPGEVGLLVDETVHLQDITAIVIDLARRGYFTIKDIPKKGWLGSQDFELTLNGKAETKLFPFEKSVMDMLFSTARTSPIYLKKPPKQAYKHLSKAKENLYQRLADTGHFTGHPQKIRQRYMILGIIFLVSGFILGPALESLPLVFATVLSGIIILIFSRFMPARTPKGRRALKEVVGLREWIRLGAWREQIHEKHNFFEEVLPYTIAFGLTDKFIKAFKAADIKKLSWYESSQPLNPAVFSHSINSFSRHVNSGVASTRPKSASSGGSGFSGGSSGGGFGGGGGGSW